MSAPLELDKILPDKLLSFQVENQNDFTKFI